MKFAAGSLSSLLIILPLGYFAAAKPALSQPITPAPDGTGTAVTPQGNTFNIQGGSLSKDGANLFHSFQKFGLGEGQTANFISNSDIRNILGRVVGGDASYINGLIRVSGGNSNLFLMNPAGILFGPNASLNVPADFTATAATGIGFGSGWFNAVGSNNYNILVGTPSAFNFAISQPGAIVNEGDLSLTAGSNLALLGGTVINTGTLASPGGNITIAAVPGESTVRLSQEGHLLSLDIEPAALTGSEVTPVLQPLSLPQLLTGRPDFGHASALSVSEKGEVSLTGSGVRIPASGGIAAGNIDTSSESGDGGAITLNATSDIITGSLRTAAGGTGTGGNIEISSSAGGINTSAGDLDASSDDGNGGNVTLSAERNIITGEILSASGEILSLGKDEWGTEQFSSKGGAGTGGNISLESRSGGLDTSAGNLFSYSLNSDGGSVTLTAFGDIQTGNIRSSSGYFNSDTATSIGTGSGSGGKIDISSSAGEIDTAGGRLFSGSNQGNGGSVTLTASGDIKTGSISSQSPGYYDSNTGTFTSTGSGGNIALNSSAGGIDTALGVLDSYSEQGNGGSVTLTASGNIKTGDIQSFSSGTGTGGNIALTSRAGGIDTASGWLDSSSTQENGGSLTLTASGNIKTGNISSFSSGTGSGGNITLNSSAGGIDTALGVLDSSSEQGNGGSLTLTASGNIKTGNIFSGSFGTGSGGEIALNSSAGGIDTAGGGLSSSSEQGNGGSLTLTASGDIKTSDISSGSFGTGSGGEIALNSSAGGIDTALGVLDSSSEQGEGGPVTLTASGEIQTGNIKSSSNGTGTGGNIALNSSAGAIQIALGELNSSSSQGNGGSISLIAATIDTASGALNSSSDQGNGGSISLIASGTLVTGDIKSSGLLRGGDITITSQFSDIIYRGFLDDFSQEGTEGQRTLNAYAGSISAGNFSGSGNIAIAKGGQDDALSPNPNTSVTTDAGKINTLSGNVTLRAHNDITVSQPVKTSSISSFELIAGRSININSGIDTSGSNGDIALRANSNSADPKYRASGAGSVTMAPGTSLNAGTGNIVIELGTLGQVGNITLSNINTAGALTVNASTGNILRSSPDSLITAGSAFLQTSILDSGGIGLPAEPLRISVRNLEATAGSGGAFFESPERGVTVGGATDLPYGIVTSGGGDLSLRAAGDITITEPVSTASIFSGNAGNISLKSSGGAINASATLQSSAAQGNGGSVTLTASGNIKTGGISSDSGTGTGGNITLNSSAGGIDTASGELSSSSTQGNGGSVTLTASGNIQTADIESSSGTGSGGNIALNSIAGGIDTASGELSSSSTQGNAGSVTLTASGDIKTGDIRSSSDGTGSGGEIALNSSAGGIDTASGGLHSYASQGNGSPVTLTASRNIKTGEISSNSQTGSGGDITIKSSAGGIDTASGTLSSSSTQENGGSVTLTASGDIQISNILSYSGSTGSGGEIALSSSAGGIYNPASGTLSSFSHQGNGGAVTLRAFGDIKTGEISSYSRGTGSGGNIALNSSAGGIDTAGGRLSSYSWQGTAGSVTLTASENIQTGPIASMAGYQEDWTCSNAICAPKFTPVSGIAGTGGDITIASTNGAVNTSTGALNTMSSGGAAGSVTVSAAGHVETAGIRSDGFLQGGNISIRSDSSNSINVGGNLDTYSTHGTAGNITTTSPGSITLTGDITSYGSTKSGSVTLTSNSGNITTRQIITQANNGPSGNIRITAPGFSGNIDTGNLISVGTSSGSIINTAGKNLHTGNQTSSATNGNSGNITNTAGSNITAGDQTSSATNGNAGNITNTAGSNITAGNQTTTATNGNSGNITNTAGNNITAGNQTTSTTNGNSGNITNTALGNINTGNQTSSATGGTAGNITNTAIGSINTGNLTSTGTSGSGDITLTSGSGQISTGEIRTDTGEVNINAGVNPVPVPVSAPAFPVPVPSATETNLVLSNLNHSVSSDSSINPNVSSRPTPTPDRNELALSSSAQEIIAGLNVLNSSQLAVNSAEAIAQLEQTREREFANYFGEDISNKLTSTQSIRDALAKIASQTGNRSAIIYVTALPDQLEVVLLTPEGKFVRKTVPAAQGEDLWLTVRDFRDEITDDRQRNTDSYLQPAQQLYKWLIAPIEAELQAAKIDTLLFSMDAGLRGVPVAALHDGKQFLVEKYSLAIIPSVSLIDTRYQPVQGKQVLAMGVSEFTDKEPLLAVPVELSEITQKLWQGKAFLNQDFTRANLMRQRSNYPYPIIHLATHGAFQPGDIRNSYIQLWEEKLRLDELRNLRLNSPPVELLVLSACRTAVGDEKAELGFAGFAVAAGVKTAVASLWYVSDAGTLGLMTEFYSHLSDAKIKAEALRQAQLAMIRGGVRIEKGELLGSKELRGVPLPAELLKEGYHNLKHPYYWSGFTMIGSPW